MVGDGRRSAHARPGGTHLSRRASRLADRPKRAGRRVAGLAGVEAREEERRAYEPSGRSRERSGWRVRVERPQALFQTASRLSAGPARKSARLPGSLRARKSGRPPHRPALPRRERTESGPVPPLVFGQAGHNPHAGPGPTFKREARQAEGRKFSEWQKGDTHR